MLSNQTELVFQLIRRSLFGGLFFGFACRYIYYLSAQCATDAPDVQRQHLLVGVVMYTSYLLLFGRLMYNKCMQM